MDDQSPFRNRGNLRELDSHSHSIHGMPHDSFQRDVLVARAQCEAEFRTLGQGIGIENKNTFQTQVADGRRPFSVQEKRFRLALKPWRGAPVFDGHGMCRFPLILRRSGAI